jgi:hypothetical protein
MVTERGDPRVFLSIAGKISRVNLETILDLVQSRDKYQWVDNTLVAGQP